MIARATPPWGLAPTGIVGAATDRPSVTVKWLHDVTLATIAPFRGQRAACVDFFNRQWPLSWPETGRVTAHATLTAMWNSPGDILLMDEGSILSVEKLGHSLARQAAVVDQSSGRLVLRLTGSKAEQALMKLVEIDLHPDVFRTGMGAITALHHISVGIFKIKDDPIYLLHCARSYAADVWHSIAEAGEEFGMKMQATDETGPKAPF